MPLTKQGEILAPLKATALKTLFPEFCIVS